MAQVTSNVPNDGLNLPDVLTDTFTLQPMLDETLLNLPSYDLDLGLKDDNPLNWTSQVYSDPPSIDQAVSAPRDEPILYEEDLGLDIDFTEGPSIEMGRDAPPPRPVAEDLMSDSIKFNVDDDLGLDFGDDGPMVDRFSTEAASAALNGDLPNGHDDNTELGPRDDFVFPVDETLEPLAAPADTRLLRDSQSPLSSARSSVVRAFEETMITEDPSVVQARQPASKKRKLLPFDTETVLNDEQFKQQQRDRSAILKPISFLPRDPVLLTLMNMQQNGDFVSNIMQDGRSKGWAPELRGILSIEVVRKAGALKRKRDSGIADVDEDEQVGSHEMPRIEIPEEDDVALPDEGIDMNDASGHEKPTMFDHSADQEMIPAVDDHRTSSVHPDRQASEDEDLSPIQDNFDDTTAPLIHPVDSGPVSLGTQHAVHLLRDKFGGSAKTSPSQQRKASVLFQDLLPEATTSKVDATKMFFEVLVLATKDAIKVEQAPNELGGPIRLRERRGLWGAWAEKEAGGEIAEGAEQTGNEVAAS